MNQGLNLLFAAARAAAIQGRMYPSSAPAPTPPAPAPAGEGYVGSTHPMTLVNPTFSTILADTDAAITANTQPVINVRNWFKETVAGPDVYGANAMVTAFMAAARPSLTDSSQNYGTWCLSNTSGVYASGLGSDSNGVVCGIEAYIDAENAREAAYTGSNSQPFWCADHFYNSRNIYIDICVAYDWLNASMSSGAKAKVIAYINNALTQLHSATPKCNGRSIPASYAYMDELNPGDNYFYGHMIATMLGYTCFGDDNPSGLTWRTKFLSMVNDILVPWMNEQLGGGNLEGTGYGMAEQFIYVTFDWWHRSTGEDLWALFPSDTWDNKLSYWAHVATPDLKYLLFYGDHARESTGAMYDYYRMLVLPIMSRYPTATTSRNMKALLANVNLVQEDPGTSLASCYHITNAIWDLVNSDAGITTGTVSGWGNNFRDDVSGHAFWRTGWTPGAAAASQGTMVGLSYGYRSQSHDHLDKDGSFLIYKNVYLSGTPNLNASSGEQQNCDMFNQVALLNGSTLMSPRNAQDGTVTSGYVPQVLFYEDGSGGYFYLSVDLAPAWASPVTARKRDLMFFPVGNNGVLVVFDRIVTSSSINKRWQLNTVYTPSISTTTNSNDTASLTGSGSITQKLTMIEPAAPALASTSWTSAMLANGDTLNGAYSSFVGSPANNGARIASTQTANDASFLAVIDVNGCLTSAVKGSPGAGEHQVVLTFAAGGTKTVTFFDGATHATVV